MIDGPLQGLQMVTLGRVFALVLVLLAGAGQAEAQGFVGSWEYTAPNGTKISLVLRQDGRRVLGSLSGNGSRFEVEAEIAADGLFYGTAKAQAGSLFIGGELNGEQLGVALAEMAAAGVPDMRNAQEMRMQRVSAGAVTPGAPTGPSPSNPGGSNPSASSPADQQLSQLLTSSPWCYMRYSQAMGATSTERVVFSRDGRVVSRMQRESSVNNREGSYYGNSTDGEQGFWRVQNGNLMLSADGQNFQPAPISVAPNSNGAPIITTGGKEYNRCN